MNDLSHQSQLAPEDNKFHVGNGADGKHYWLTPPDLLASLAAEFGPFDFDPCPYPLTEGFDGLTCEWGQRNYVNPPFGSIMHQGRKKGPTAWVRKAIVEWRKGKTVILVYPIDKWILMLLDAVGAKVRNLGDVGTSPVSSCNRRMPQTAHQSRSASPLSHAETPLTPAFLRYPDFSCGVQRNSTRAVAGFLRGGLPLGRLGLSIADIMPVQIILDKGCGEVFTVRT